jgi:multidrug efflux pump subunit AcrA (membrane-fusion protein)
MKLDQSILTATLDQIKAIDARMTASAGNVTARKAEARTAIRNTDDGLALVEAEQLAVDALEAAKSAADEARQAIEDAVVAYLKAQKADVGAELSTLRTERDELVNTAKAMATLLKVADLEIPKAPKGSGSGSTSPRVAKSSSGSHYVKAEDGSTSSYANDTFSGLAFYAFKRAGVPALKSALEANGVTELTKPWETTVTVNGITRTIGHRVEASEG